MQYRVSSLLALRFLGDAFREADGTGGADEAAEVAPYALRAHDAGLTGVGVEGDGLMTAIITALGTAIGVSACAPSLLPLIGMA